MQLVMAWQQIWCAPMTCALGDVCDSPQVIGAQVSFDMRQATGTFDDAKTNVDALIRATKDAGYPSALVDSAK